MIELRQQLDKERSVRMMLEEQVRLWGQHSTAVAVCGEGSPSSGLCRGDDGTIEP